MDTQDAKRANGRVMLSVVGTTDENQILGTHVGSRFKLKFKSRQFSNLRG